MPLTRFEKTYTEMFPLLLRQAEFLLGSRADAEDAVQNVFLKVMRRGPDDHRRLESSYLQTAVRNEV